MRFILMHKNDPHTEAGEMPPMEQLQQMRAFIGEHAQAGKFLDGQGLGGSKTRTRMVFRDARATVKHGPYRGDNELAAAMLVLEVRTRDAAIGWAERYGKILGDGEIELAKMIEPWDVGLMPEPDNPPLHFLLIDKADNATERDGRTAKQKADLTRLRTEMTKAGVLLGSLDLEPSANAKRLRFRSNDLTVTDGPFSESKELIGGFLVMELSGFDEAIEVSRRYAAIQGGTQEIDLRLVFAPAGPLTQDVR
jgi:hypothetical protein